MVGKTADASESGDPEAYGWVPIGDGWYGRGPLPDGGWRRLWHPGDTGRTDGGLTWRWVAEHWDIVSADLHHLYGIDTADPTVQYSRSWGWLRDRIRHLVTARSRTLWAVTPTADREKILKAMAHGAEVPPWI